MCSLMFFIPISHVRYIYGQNQYLGFQKGEGQMFAAH